MSYYPRRWKSRLPLPKRRTCKQGPADAVPETGSIFLEIVIPLKAPLDDLNIPELSEAASDAEIKTAYRYLCELQKNLGALQNQISRNSRIVYNKLYQRKREKLLPAGRRGKWENGKEPAAVENSRSIMKELGQRRAHLTEDPVLLAEVDSWRSK